MCDNDVRRTRSIILSRRGMLNGCSNRIPTKIAARQSHQTIGGSIYDVGLGTHRIGARIIVLRWKTARECMTHIVLTSSDVLTSAHGKIIYKTCESTTPLFSLISVHFFKHVR